MTELFAKPPGILGHVAMIITINAMIALTLFIVNLLGFLLGLLIFIPALVGFTSFIWVSIAWSPKDWSEWFVKEWWILLLFVQVRRWREAARESSFY